MVKYRIVYLGDDKYLAWDADNQRFVPAGMHLYITKFNTVEDALAEMRKVKRSCSGWVNDIYHDSVWSDSKPEVKKFLFQF